MPSDFTIGNYEIDDDSNGDLVIKDTNDNVVLQWDDANGKWVLGSNAPIDISELVDGAGVSHTGELEDINHSTKHENAGSDEISVAGLSGDLADAQDPKTHSTTHSDGSTDEITVENLATNGAGGQVPTSDGAGGLSMTAPNIPSGVIAMWSGTTTDVPAGWTLCDGTDSTPDLRDRFVVGAGTSYSAGNTGGQDEVQLSVNEIPSHTHTETIRGLKNNGDNSGTDDTEDDGSELTRDTGSTGGDSAHENRPPYYALAYIMKI